MTSSHEISKPRSQAWQLVSNGTWVVVVESISSTFRKQRLHTKSLQERCCSNVACEHYDKEQGREKEHSAPAILLLGSQGGIPKVDDLWVPGGRAWQRLFLVSGCISTFAVEYPVFSSLYIKLISLPQTLCVCQARLAWFQATQLTSRLSHITHCLITLSTKLHQKSWARLFWSYFDTKGCMQVILVSFYPY
jgi:hypothetical protein